MNLAGKRVLVTGADGFIGSHLVEALVAHGAEVRAFVVYNSLGSWGWLDTLPEATKAKLEVVAGDIRDPHVVSEAVRGVDAVLHLAALIAIPYSYVAPASYVETNVTGTLHVLTAARTHGTARVLVTSTSEVYGTARYVPIDERHPLSGQSPYAATKIGADRLAESFHKSFGVPVVIARPFNTYGPRQSARAVLPTIVTQLLSGADEIRLGNLAPTRDLNFVTDTCRGMIALAECDAAVGEEVQIATQTEVSVGDLATRLVALIRPEARIVTEAARLRPEASEVERLVGSNQKIRALTGWSPQVELDEGLARTLAWFREPGNLARYRAHHYAT
ncbi:MAG: SDR family NAD(P)-dependent oxidoreductase [Myxococcales bacterium]|nr:SDR family NAD(P)-dependent oxidoreductase [Myxococcales bacterium]